MKTLERLVLAAGLATMGWLLWKFNPAAVWTQVSGVGLGFAVILPFQIFDHALNALGWRFAFSRRDSSGIPFRTLVKIRIAGDGVNYLTPSGTIAGEFIRPGMLGDLKSAEVKNASVVVAKFAQALGQALFILLGILFVLQGRLNFLQGRQRLLGIGGALLVIALVGLALYMLTGPAPGLLPQSNGKLTAIRGQMRLYLKAHPGRFALSTLFFMGGYAWGAFEVFLICRFMGMSVPLLTAFAVEVLSNIIDSLMFMVPAKVGTQEAGKTAIFHALGYPASQGLAFGLIRHVREIIWAGAGFLIYALSRPKASPRALPQESPEPLAEPLVPAD